MWFDDPAAREAFRRGARDAFESCELHMKPSERQAVIAWIAELEDWHGGHPPEAPVDW